MRPIDAHAWQLGRLLCHDDLPAARPSDSQVGWYAVGNWMMAAGGLQGVTFDLDAFDEQSVYCPAPHPQEVLDELDGFVRDLARFSFVWLAFEGTMKQLRTRSQLRKGGGEARTAVAMLRELEAGGRPSPVHSSCSSVNLARVLARAKSRTFEKAAAELPDAAAVSRLLGTSRLWTAATSFGGVHSTVDRRAQWGGDAVPEGLRLSCGIEDTADLVADLAAALAAALGAG